MKKPQIKTDQLSYESPPLSQVVEQPGAYEFSDITDPVFKEDITEGTELIGAIGVSLSEVIIDDATHSRKVLRSEPHFARTLDDRAKEDVNHLVEGYDSLMSHFENQPLSTPLSQFKNEALWNAYSYISKNGKNLIGGLALLKVDGEYSTKTFMSYGFRMDINTYAQNLTCDRNALKRRYKAVPPDLNAMVREITRPQDNPKKRVNPLPWVVKSMIADGMPTREELETALHINTERLVLPIEPSTTTNIPSSVEYAHAA